MHSGRNLDSQASSLMVVWREVRCSPWRLRGGCRSPERCLASHFPHCTVGTLPQSQGRVWQAFSPAPAINLWLGLWESIGVHSSVLECPRETTQPLSRWASVHLPSLQPRLARPQGGFTLVNCTFPGRASRLMKFISCQRQKISRQQRAGL